MLYLHLEDRNLVIGGLNGWEKEVTTMEIVTHYLKFRKKVVPFLFL